MVQEKIKSPHLNRKDKGLMVLSYFWLFSVIVLLKSGSSKQVYHHARRGLVLFIFSLFFLWIDIWSLQFLVLFLALYGIQSAHYQKENQFPIWSELADGTLRPRHFTYYLFRFFQGIKDFFYYRRKNKALNDS